MPLLATQYRKHMANYKSRRGILSVIKLLYDSYMHRSAVMYAQTLAHGIYLMRTGL